MLWTIFIILLVLWLLGMVSSYTLGGFIHVLLVVAIVVRFGTEAALGAHIGIVMALQVRTQQHVTAELAALAHEDAVALQLRRQIFERVLAAVETERIGDGAEVGAIIAHPFTRARL